MGNTNSVSYPQDNPRFTSRQIRENIKNVFDMDKSHQDFVSDTIGWYDQKTNTGNKCFVTCRRYNNYKPSNYNNNRLNIINEQSELLNDGPSKDDLNIINEQSELLKDDPSNDDMNIVNKKSELLCDRFDDDTNEKNKLLLGDNLSNDDIYVSSDITEIEMLKKMIDNQRNKGKHSRQLDYISHSPFSTDSNVTEFGILKDVIKNHQNMKDKEKPNYTNDSLNTDSNISELEQLKNILNKSNLNITHDTQTRDKEKYQYKTDLNRIRYIINQSKNNPDNVFDNTDLSGFDTSSNDSDLQRVKDMIINKYHDDSDMKSSHDDIKLIKEIIDRQAGGCGCSVKDINISPSIIELKGGAIKNDDSVSNYIDDIETTNDDIGNNDDDHSDTYDDYQDDESSDDHYSDDNYSDDDNDSNFNDYDEYDESDYTESSFTGGDVSYSDNPRGKINAVPFYSSTDSIRASTYFKRLM